ncbi:glucose regulated protein 75 [Boletus coccyginus]|nr:glucose regulated protein 75 [Boletus coccyginus]
MVLTKMKETAEPYLNKKVNHAVITVPTYFNDAHGGPPRMLVRSPAWACTVSSMNPPLPLLHMVLTWQIPPSLLSTVLAVVLSISQYWRCKGTSSRSSQPTVTHLDGEDFNISLVDHILKDFQKESGITLNQVRVAVQCIREAAEKPEIELSSTTQTEINLPFITAGVSGLKHINPKLNRANFESLVKSVVWRIVEPCRNAPKDASVTASDADEVILVGGIMTKLINRKATFSTTKTLQTFPTAADGQTAIEVKIYQGERELARDDKLHLYDTVESLLEHPRGPAASLRCHGIHCPRTPSQPRHLHGSPLRL